MSGSALLFEAMENKDGRIIKNRPPYQILDVGGNKKEYYDSVLNKFIDKFYPQPSPVLVHVAEDDTSCLDDQNFVENYFLCLPKYYFILLDLKDAVREGTVQDLLFCANCWCPVSNHCQVSTHMELKC